jgi:phage baseplate assembly protein W
MPDVALTRFTGVPGGLVLDFAHSWGTLDLAVAPNQNRAAPGAGRTRPSVRGTPPGLAAVSGRANLAQALILRLLTPRGSLAGLGHPSYGSRLGELIGRRNDVTARNLARLYLIEAIDAEPRVVALQALDVRTDPGRPDVIAISFAVVPIARIDPSGDPVALALELAT